MTGAAPQYYICAMQRKTFFLPLREISHHIGLFSGRFPIPTDGIFPPCRNKLPLSSTVYPPLVFIKESQVRTEERITACSFFKVHRCTCTMLRWKIVKFSAHRRLNCRVSRGELRLAGIMRVKVNLPSRLIASLSSEILCEVWSSRWYRPSLSSSSLVYSSS
jgi:hypothetical protein